MKQTSNFRHKIIFASSWRNIRWLHRCKHEKSVPAFTNECNFPNKLGCLWSELCPVSANIVICFKCMRSRILYLKAWSFKYSFHKNRTAIEQLQHQLKILFRNRIKILRGGGLVKSNVEQVSYRGTFVRGHHSHLVQCQLRAKAYSIFGLALSWRRYIWSICHLTERGPSDNETTGLVLNKWFTYCMSMLILVTL